MMQVDPDSQSVVICSRPTRVILNFAHRCALNCEWCYVPFDTPPVNADVVEAIVARVAVLGFASITIGGGDPFQYSFIGKILHKAHSVGLFVHVDTHGKSLRQSDGALALIRDCVDLIGLPLDGPTAAVHDEMRSETGHFDIVISRISWLKSLHSRLKINTVISARNVRALPELQVLVGAILPIRWSIYQYWPLGPAKHVSEKHMVGDLEFQEYTAPAREKFKGSTTSLEINGREDRRDTYPIVHHDGFVYIHSASPLDDFLGIGSIFDADILERISNACGPERTQAVTRYLRLPISSGRVE